MIYFLAFILSVGILVTIHELGHFLIAKLLKVKVKVFSIGFGPTLLKRKIGETIYKISLIPLGGYVRFEDEKKFFQHEKLYKKILIVLGGPLANILFSYIILVFLFYFSFKLPYVYTKTPIFYSFNISSPLTIYNNEIVSKINNSTVKTYYDLKLIAKETKSPYFITLENNKTLKLSSLKNIYPYMEPVGYVEPNSTLSKFNLSGKIRFLSIENYSIKSWNDIEFYKLLVLKKKNTMKIKLYSYKTNKTKTLVLSLKSAHDKFGIRYVYAYKTIKKKISFIEANKLALKTLIDYTKRIFTFIGSLINSPKKIEKNLGGPVSIAKFSGDALQHGVESFIIFLALLSLQLGILNLLPIPVLDGGHLFIFFIEAIIRKPIPEDIRYELQFIGFVILMFLTFLAISADFHRYILK